MGTKNHLAENDLHLKKILAWETFPNVPQKLSGLYHGAIKMDLLLRLKTKRGDWFKYFNHDFEIGWLISLETDLTFMSERPFSINGASPESNSWGVKDPQISKRNLERMIAQGAPRLDGWDEDLIKNFEEAGGDFTFFSMLPVAVFGTTLRFCKEFSLEIKDETKLNFAKILIARSLAMANKEAFDWYLFNTRILLDIFFKKKVNFKNPIFETSKTGATKSGLIGEELWIQRDRVPGNYEDLARLILSLLPAVKR